MRARDLAPELSKRARECEERRSLPPETIAAFRDAGLLRLLRPARFGGYEVGLASLIEIVREVGRACGSSAWCLALFATHNRLVGLFGEQAQREVFDTDVEAPLAAVYAPGATAMAVEAGSKGFRLSGRWQFASGCDHAGWVALAARVPRQPEGPIPDIRCLLVPAGEFRIDDTWFVSGLRGTGSKDVVVEEAFVPAHRALSFLDLSRGTAPGLALNPSPLFRLPVVPLLALVAAGAALGLAQAATESFRERARARASQRASSPSQIGQVALAAALATIDAAALFLQRDVEDLAWRARSGERLSAGSRARYLLDAAFVVASCTRALDRQVAVSGAGALFDDCPLQRACRDLRAMSAHAALQLEPAMERFGRIELGLPTDSPLLLI